MCVYVCVHACIGVCVCTGYIYSVYKLLYRMPEMELTEEVEKCITQGYPMMLLGCTEQIDGMLMPLIEHFNSRSKESVETKGISTVSLSFLFNSNQNATLAE